MRPSKVTVIIFILWAAMRGSGELLDVKLFLWGFYTPPSPPPPSFHSPLFTHYFITTPAHVQPAVCTPVANASRVEHMSVLYSVFVVSDITLQVTMKRLSGLQSQLTTKFRLDKETSVRNHRITWHSSFIVVVLWKPVRKSDRTLFIRRNAKSFAHTNFVHERTLQQQKKNIFQDE